ncbi:MAG: hypothetical protein WD042_04740 [Phycisphaeraceae bacterium]
MKIGIVISVVIVLLLSTVFFVTAYGIADSPTGLTMGAAVAKQELLSGLPAVYQPSDPGASANQAYQELFDYYMANKSDLGFEDPNMAKVDQVIDLLIKASNAGQVQTPFFDDQIEMKYKGAAKFEAAIEAISYAVGMRIVDLYESDKQRATAASEALFALGHRLFTQSVRLYLRFQGVTIMEGTAAVMEANGDDRGKPWREPTRAILSNWEEKDRKVLGPLSAPMGDLMNLAKKDPDRTFRVEAILRLGVAKFAPGSKGNARAIASILADAKQSDDAYIREAATAADALTREEMRRM